MIWDPDAYLRYADERSLPFFHLVAAVRHPSPRHVVDLGCGPGGLTATLMDRWPDAAIVGVDSDPEMIGRAVARSVPDRLQFELGDVRCWRGSQAPDVILSNACLHWVPDHPALLADLARRLAPRGFLAFQVPDNFDRPSHCLTALVRHSPRWRDRLVDVPTASVEPLGRYCEVLTEAGLSPFGWRTTYRHVLPGDDPVLEWLRGSTLRPVLAALGPADGARFCSELAPHLREAYPPGPDGTMFEFQRLFVAATVP